MEVFALFGARVCSLGRERRTEWTQSKLISTGVVEVMAHMIYSHYATIAASRTSETNDCRPGRRICTTRISLLGGNGDGR